MAANFWGSSHHNLWILDKSAKDRGCPKDRDYFSDEEIRKLRIYFINFLDELGEKVKVRKRLVATASVYFKRFYHTNSFCTFHPCLVAPATIFLASKVEECTIPAKTLISVLKERDQRYAFEMRDLLECEYFVLEELKFDLLVYHPYKPLLEFVKDANAMHCLKSAWYIVNDSFSTDCCLHYFPHMIAIAALQLAAAYQDHDLQPWLRGLNLQSEHKKNINEIMEELLKLFENGAQPDRKEMERLLDKLPNKRRKPA